jgi:putative transposase
MPWKETCRVEQRLKFITMWKQGEYTVTALSKYFGISRQKAYKWINRYEEEGIEGLRDRSRRPHSHPATTPSEVQEAILRVRRKRGCGPTTILAYLRKEAPEVRWPARSTVAEILRRNGLTARRKRRRRTEPYTEPFAPALGPNSVWTADFKGWFKTRDNQRCDPLTIQDSYSRYSIRCNHVVPRTEPVQGVFEAAFRENGLPEVILTDNGPPFSSTALAGLTRLTAWWLKLGIKHQRIEPGKPQQNGRHERFHRTLKKATCSPPANTLRAQQAAFDEFREHYNYERPHQAIDCRTPSELYRPSPRLYPRIIQEPDYSWADALRRVRLQGTIKWSGGLVYLGKALVRETVALTQIDDSLWAITFARTNIAILDTNEMRAQRLSEHSPKVRERARALTVKVLPMIPG